jgi:hypothetical protein
MNLQGALTAKTTVLKDPDGNIIETGIVDMIESKGLEFTYDSEGNIMLIKRPLPKQDPRIKYTLMEGEQVQNGPWRVSASRVKTTLVGTSEEAES